MQFVSDRSQSPLAFDCPLLDRTDSLRRTTGIAAARIEQLNARDEERLQKSMDHLRVFEWEI